MSHYFLEEFNLFFAVDFSIFLMKLLVELCVVSLEG